MAARICVPEIENKMATSGELKRVLDAVNDIGKTMATLKAEVGFMSGAVRDLGSKVDRIEETKAAKIELVATELRLEKSFIETKAGMEKSVAEVKTAASMEASRNNIEWTGRLDKIDDYLEKQSIQIDELEKIRWRVAGISSIIGAMFGSFLAALFAWLFHLIPIAQQSTQHFAK